MSCLSWNIRSVVSLSASELILLANWTVLPSILLRGARGSGEDGLVLGIISKGGMLGFPPVAETEGCPFVVEATDEAAPFVPFAMDGIGLAGAEFERLCVDELRSSLDRLGGTGGVGLAGAALERLCVDKLRASFDRLGGTGE